MRQPQIDNLGLVDISNDHEPCVLAEQAARATPSFTTNAEASAAFSRELEALAAKHRMSIESLVAAAESSLLANDDYDRARSLVRFLSYSKR